MKLSKELVCQGIPAAIAVLNMVNANWARTAVKVLSIVQGSFCGVQVFGAIEATGEEAEQAAQLVAALRSECDDCCEG